MIPGVRECNLLVNLRKVRDFSRDRVKEQAVEVIPLHLRMRQRNNMNI
jgi:hypothetical protein